MRLLLVSSDPGIPIHGPAGGSAHLRGVVRGLTANGHDVSVVARCGVDERGRVADPLTKACARRVVVPPHTAAWPRRRTPGSRHVEAWRWARLVRRVAREVRPDVVWERSWAGRGADIGGRVARRLSARHLLEVNAPMALERSAALPVSDTLASEQARWTAADRVVAVSGWLTAHIRRLAPDAQVVHVPNGSSLDIPPASRDAVRESLGWYGPVAIHHGTLRAWHGLSAGDVLDILDALGRAGWRVVVVGDAPAAAPVVRHPAVERLPHADPEALARLLYAADVGLAPYPPSAPPWLDPLKLADCRALGLPVVGSVHPATVSCAKQVPLHDPGAWVSAARELQGVRERTPRPWSVVCAEALEGW